MTVANVERHRLDIMLDEWQRIRDDRDTCCDLLYSVLEARTVPDAELAMRLARAYLLASA